MVTMAQLRDLDVGAWSGGVDEWRLRSDELLGAARELTGNAAGPLRSGAWTGPAGDMARQRVDELIDRLKVDSLECRAISFVLNGVTQAFQIAQGSLRSTLDAAARLAFPVGDDGEVRLPASPMVRHDPEYHAWCQEQRRRLQTLIRQALDSATQADRRGHDALDRLADRTSVTSVDTAKDDDLGEASRLEVDLIAGTVPTGNRDRVAAWWASLPASEQRALTLAAPWTVADLDGIPDTVRKELNGDDGHDRTQVAKWAIDNWDNDDIDIFDNNCTSFASDALSGGGLEDKVAFWGTLDDDSWNRGAQTGWGWLDKRDYSHSASWAQAQASYEFWSEHGTEVGESEARPGDIIYWEQDADGYDNPRGTVHHTAVVTSVIDGDIRYTQHSDQRLQVSLDGRAPINEFSGGHQKIHIVRPDPDG